MLLKMFIGLHVKHRLFLSHLNETWLFWTGFKEKYSKTKFHEDPSSGSRVISFGWRDRWTDEHDEANSRCFAVLRTQL